MGRCWHEVNARARGRTLRADVINLVDGETAVSRMPGHILSMLVVMGLAMVSATPATGGEPGRFVDETFEHFSAGRLGGGGFNLYVARDGTVRTINRFDLNSDGHLDLVFNCTHDTYQMLPATVGMVDEKAAAVSHDLPVEGSQRVVLGDLNKDGHLDAVFCPNAIGVHHPRRFLSVAWGGPEGWSGRRVTSGLPMNEAASVRIVDLNHDGWADIAVLGGGRWRIAQTGGRIIRVFHGSSRGFSAAGFTDLGVEKAVEIAAADFDSDGSDDLAVLRSDGLVTVFWSETQRQDVHLPGNVGLCVAGGDVDGDGRSDLVVGTSGEALWAVRSGGNRKWFPPESYSAHAASQVVVGRVDDDNSPDLVLTRFSSARAAGGEQAGAGQGARDAVIVLWGRSAGAKGPLFSRDRQLRLAAPAAAASAIGDLDGDGHNDLAVAVHQANGTFNGKSRAWLGDGKRGFREIAGGFRTSGTTDVAIASANKVGSRGRVVFSNSIGGRYDEAVPVHVYWGGRDGFDPERVWKIPFQSGYESSAADLNADGHVDLVLLNSGHSHTDTPGKNTLGVNIFWGGKNGYDLEKRRSVIHEHYLGTSSVADLDRDGWLDLVLEAFAPEGPGQVDQLFVYYGSAKGFGHGRRVQFDKPGYSQEHVVADLNDDGWLDIAHGSRSQHTIRILWGQRDGFSVKRSSLLNLAGVLGMSAADLDGDGQVDLFAGTYADPVSVIRDMGSRIFWGDRRRGFQQSNSQWLPGFSPLGRTIADFDGDGHLDIFSPQHSGELTREDLACHIYWGSATGFHTRRRSTLICDSVNDSLAGDFNGDGLIDLAVACHTRHGNHRAFSRVFYNDGNRFRNPRMTRLPTNGTHLMWALDIGNVMDRSYRETFVSRTLEWDGEARRGRVRVEADVPRGGGLSIAVRAAAARKQLASRPWQAVQGRKFTLLPDERVLQYRATFSSDNGDRYPVLDRVEIKLTD